MVRDIQGVDSINGQELEFQGTNIWSLSRPICARGTRIRISPRVRMLVCVYLDHSLLTFRVLQRSNSPCR